MASTPFNVAAAAYGNASRLFARPEGESVASAVSAGPDFAQMLAQSVQGVVANRAADPVSVAMVGDAASLMLQQAAIPGAPLGSVPAKQGNDFANILAQSVQSVVDTGRASEQMSMDTINGKANVVDMVTALSQTEIAIESIVTIRDRVIASYEEIMRMPI